jgi:hypothetical protein
MHAIQAGEAGKAWAALGKTLPRPRAILIASAHWEASVPMLTGNRQPSTIHDFGGFPPELYKLRYPAPGLPELATQAVTLLKDAGVTPASMVAGDSITVRGYRCDGCIPRPIFRWCNSRCNRSLAPHIMCGWDVRWRRSPTIAC